MACYDGIIGINGLCDNKQYKVLLDEVGISLYKASKIADERHITGRSLIEKKITQAWKETFKDFRFNGFSANKILSVVDVGDVTTTVISPIAEERGIKLSQYVGCSKLSRIFISSIYVHVKTGGETSLILKKNGVEIFRQEFIAENESVAEIAYNDFVEDGTDVLIDLTNISVYDTTTSLSCDCKSHLLKVEGDGAGLTLTAQLRCDTTAYLCQFVDILAEAVKYKAAALIYKEVWDSSRLNDIVCIEKETCIEKMAWLDSTYNLLKYDPSTEASYKPSGMYQQELKKISIPAPKCKCCMECKSDSYNMVKP